jgi:hypothetical protein
MKWKIVICLVVLVVVGVASHIPYTMLKYRYGFMDATLRCLMHRPGETAWAGGFSESAFLSLRPGMTRDDVQRILGPALRRWDRDFPDCAWSYSWQTNADDNFDARTVLFDTNGLVKQIVREYYID